LSSAKMASASKQAAAKEAEKKRQADGDFVVTRQELMDALAKLAAEQKQARCDITTVLRHEIKRVLDERGSPRSANGQEEAAYLDEGRNAQAAAEYDGAGYEPDERNAPWPLRPAAAPQRRVVIGRPPIAATPPTMVPPQFAPSSAPSYDWGYYDPYS